MQCCSFHTLRSPIVPRFSVSISFSGYTMPARHLRHLTCKPCNRAGKVCTLIPRKSSLQSACTYFDFHWGQPKFQLVPGGGGWSRAEGVFGLVKGKGGGGGGGGVAALGPQNRRAVSRPTDAVYISTLVVL